MFKFILKRYPRDDRVVVVDGVPGAMERFFLLNYLVMMPDCRRMEVKSPNWQKVDDLTQVWKPMLVLYFSGKITFCRLGVLTPAYAETMTFENQLRSHAFQCVVCHRTPGSYCLKSNLFKY